jgi:RNA polymerase sigma-70 factor (ECF subfamily)
MEEILIQYGNYIYNYALRLTAHPEDAKDLAQETFLQAWNKRNSLANEAAAKAWLRKICFHIFLMNLRKNKDIRLEEDIDLLEVQGKLLVTQIPDPEEEIVIAENVRELQNGCFFAMVRKLTLQQRAAFSLVDMFGLSIEEAADLLDVTPGALKGLLFRARRSLDGFFAGHCEWVNSLNPCKCSAWIGFWQNRDKNQDNMKKTLINHLDYRENKYTFDPVVRSRVRYLYECMPDKNPGQVWFDQVIAAVKA